MSEFFKWYIYRLIPYSDGDLFALVKEHSFSSRTNAQVWLSNQKAEIGETYLIRGYRNQVAPNVISLKAESGS